MEEILKIILDYGLTGGALVVLCFVIIQQQKQAVKQTEILSRMEERMARSEELQRQIIDDIKTFRSVSEHMVSAVEYCKSKNK
jgi:hypothetical protein